MPSGSEQCIVGNKTTLNIGMGSTIDFKGCITHGPWGGEEGKKWVYMPQGLIEKIIIQHGSAVDSIKFQTNCSKGQHESSFFGDKVIWTNSEVTTISIDHPNEYLLSISGTVGSKSGDNVVMSICFVTNLNLYGPYGTEDGDAFSYDVKDGVIIGFHGRASKYVNAIGVYTMPKSLAPCPTSTNESIIENEGGTIDFEGYITHGPWGGSQGKIWVYMPHGSIEKIIVQHDTAVESIKFQTNSSKGEPQSSVFGNKVFRSRSQVQTISIDCPNEYLMSVSGTVGSVGGYDLVKSIYFMTNMNTYGPYGTNNGTAFSYDVKDGVIVGFHGREGRSYLVAIGVYAMPKSPAPSLTSPYEGKIKNDLCGSVSRMTLPRDAGPWGGCGGKPWDDGVFSTIKQVRVHLGELNVIYGLHVEYMKSDGESVLSQIHGGTDGNEIHLVNLDNNDEFLTGISGFYGPLKGFDGLEAIVSISFHTNLRIFGPYGEETGAGYVPYSSTASSGKVVGFHGRNNGFLRAIGVHMEYF